MNEQVVQHNADYVAAGNALAEALRGMESPLDHVFLSREAEEALARWADLFDGSVDAD